MQYRFLTVLLILPLVLPSALPAADAYSAAAPSPDLKAKSLGMDHRPARPPDEVDELIERLRPPARFSGYQPNFRVTQRTFTFQHVSGPIEKTWNVVMDGPRYVALVRSGDFNLLALTPDQAETKLIMPQGRYHLDTQQGPTLCTHQFLRGVKVHGAIYEDRFAKPNDQWEGGGRTITLVRSVAGEDRVVSHRFTVAVDPVLGYTITGRYDVRFSSPPTAKDRFVGPTFCPGCYTLWPETQVYERTVYCAGAGQTRYRGWANNLIAMDRGDSWGTCCWRDRGFIAFLDRDGGWSPCRTRVDGGGDVRMPVCNAHNDFHVRINLPADLPRDEKGRYVFRATHRLVAMPPELTEHVWQNMELFGTKQSAVMVRIGTVEDFEDQPIALNRPVRGLTWTGGARVSTKFARSGKQSLYLKGTSWPNLPQCSLLPKTTYLLEAWFKVVNRDPAVSARAFIKGDFYEWSPHSRTWVTLQKTTVATGAKEGWQRVYLEFTTPAWDPFINIVFVVENGEAYMDDFRLVRVGVGPGRQVPMVAPDRTTRSLGAEEIPQIETAQPLVDLERSAPQVNDRNCTIAFRVENLLPGREFRGTISRVDGSWEAATGTLLPNKRLKHDIDASGLAVAGDRLGGTLRLKIKPEKGREALLPVTCTVQATLTDLADQPLFEKDLEVRQFWTVRPRSQGAVYSITGEYRSTSPGVSERGQVAGFVFPPSRAGFWNMGRWRDGLQLDFDMGTRRVNWNHVRLAVLTFRKPRDLSSYHGLRLRIATRQPRDDVEVSVWLREEDGSWYYLKSAVPIMEKTNTALLEFEDFVEAEWVSPTNHMDEDFVLDLSSLSHVAVGIVNPLGVGRVAFTVTALDVVTAKRRPVTPAAIAVSGKTLSVNGHEFVPPGIFGGFANELPQRYRPGCQRSLYAPRYPHIPQQVYVLFSRGSRFKDWPALLALLRGTDEKRKRLSDHLSSLLSDHRRGRLSRVRPERYRDGDRVPGELIEALNELLWNTGLYKPEVFRDIDLDGEISRRLGRLRRDEHTDTERLELNRRLLDAALPDLIPPLPKGRATELFWIDCYGERKQPADLLLNPHWKRHLYDYGRDMALNAKKNRYQPHFEFWNEPYLNWAERSRVHLNSRFYRTDLAEVGGNVHIKRGSRFSSYDVLDWPTLLSRINPEKSEEAPPPIQRIRELLSRRARQHFSEPEPDQAALRRDVLGSLNDMLRKRTLYSTEAWRGVALPPYAQELLVILSETKPPPDKLATLNRALITAALPGVFAEDPSRSAPEVVPHFRWVKDGAEGLKVVDTTAFTYWSGRGNGWIYDQMFEPFARGVKDAYAEAQVIAGWGFRWNEDHWAAWDMLYKPTIDRHIQLLDGIHEHHYQGDTIAMNGSYEVLEAYTVTAHKKWVYAYNTETNDLIDAPARGRVDTPEKAQAASQYRKLVYNLRDIVYCVLQSPDKIRSRTMIHWQRSPDATRVCFGMLKNLRGRLIETSSSDNKVWCVAAIDGTDPRAMPRDFDGTLTLVVVVFNDHRTPRHVEIKLRAPEGTTFTAGSVERSVVDKRSFALDLLREPTAVSGNRATFTVTLPERSAWKAALSLASKPPPGAQVKRQQFFSPDILKDVRPGKPFRTTVAIDSTEPSAAKRAWLRLVVEDLSPGEGRVVAGGTTLLLPKARTADNVNHIVELPLPLLTLENRTELAFEVCPGNHAGYRVDMASIVLEQRSN